MKELKHLAFLLLFVVAGIGSYPQTTSGNLKVMFERTGAFLSNCYLVCDIESREAVLIDPGDEVNRLLRHIDDNGLDLKYILITHCHPDQIYGIISMNLREKYPSAKICFSREEYQDMFSVIARWRHAYPAEFVRKIESYVDYLEIFDMDYEAVGCPDILIEDYQVFELGDFEIGAIKTPGHARGSVSFYIDKYLFSGDELMFRKAGETKTSPVSSFGKQILSVRKLYMLLPDETIVYPGHGCSTTIGAEKLHNRNITMEKAVQ